MGLFDLFRKKSPMEVMQAEMRRLAPILFPGGHDQIQAAGKSIAAMLDNRISTDGAARLYASTKYFAHTASDKRKDRVVQYILRQGLGGLTPADASEVYDRFISSPSHSKTEKEQPTLPPQTESQSKRDAWKR